MNAESEANWPRALFFCVVIGAVAIILGSVLGGIIVVAIGIGVMIVDVCAERKRLCEARERAKRGGSSSERSS